jgi:hypothetical protein
VDEYHIKELARSGIARNMVVADEDFESESAISGGLLSVPTFTNGKS